MKIIVQISHQEESYLNWDLNWKAGSLSRVPQYFLCSTIKCPPLITAAQEAFLNIHFIYIKCGLLHGPHKAWMISKFHPLCQCLLINSGCLEHVLRWIPRQRPCLVRKNDMVGFLCLPWSSVGEVSALVLCLPPWQPWIIIVILGKEYRKGRFLEMLANSAICFTEERDSCGSLRNEWRSRSLSYLKKKKEERNEWRKIIFSTLILSMGFWSIDLI